MGLMAALGLRAQTPPSLENDVRNILSAQPASAWPPPPPSNLVDARTPSPRQFKAGTILGGWQTARTYRRGVTITNPSFETPVLTAGSWTNYSPADTGWVMTNAGVTTQSTWFSPAAVDGQQGAFMQGEASLYQDVYLAAGTYSIRFKAVGRLDTLHTGLRLYLGTTLLASWRHQPDGVARLCHGQRDGRDRRHLSLEV